MGEIMSGIRECPREPWQDIATAPKPQDWLRVSGRFLVGCWHQPTDEDGNPDGEGDWAWVQCVGLTSSGWHVNTGGFKGVHGYGSFPTHGNATHWMRLPPIGSGRNLADATPKHPPSRREEG